MPFPYRLTWLIGALWIVMDPIQTVTYVLGAAIGIWLLLIFLRSVGRARAESDALLDRFMPVYEVVEHHHIRVHAPASITVAAAKELNLNDSALVRAIFRAREIVLRTKPGGKLHSRGIIAETRALGWGVLAEVPDREIVMGAVTQPWMGNVRFRSVPPEAFAAFNEPAYAKIVWTLRADPCGVSDSDFITETRVTTTDAFARAKFRRYWTYVSPGIVLIRIMSIRLVKREAERRYRATGNTTVKMVPPAGEASM
ncbi:MAG: hypothetical protein ND807_17880 [Vicinamibacterales bacterium]|nr:hypothetical protein [Vicinamibacterales bacterium]